MRPVVSCIDSPTYFLAETFNDILNQALPKPFSFIKNSFEVRSKIQILVIPDNYVPLQEFKEGIELLMNSTYFQFENKYYKQMYGTPMGLPFLRSFQI